MTEEMYAWCAGFFDAEGCIRISRPEVPVNDSDRLDAPVISESAQAEKNAADSAV